MDDEFFSIQCKIKEWIEIRRPHYSVVLKRCIRPNNLHNDLLYGIYNNVEEETASRNEFFLQDPTCSNNKNTIRKEPNNIKELLVRRPILAPPLQYVKIQAENYARLSNIMALEAMRQSRFDSNSSITTETLFSGKKNTSRASSTKTSKSDRNGEQKQLKA